MTKGLSASIASRLRLPAIAAPMLRVSGPALVSAACQAGVIGAFPTANARSSAQLDEWLHAIESANAHCDRPSAPHAANVIIRQPRLDADLETLVRHRVEIVITSVGSPETVIGPLHDSGALVLADVATLRHAEAALTAGADGLVLLSAGAGGQTGHLNPFAFTRAVRRFFDGPVVLAGGMCDGYALHSARALGCDLGYVGTPFIATTESSASAGYKRMLVDCSMDEVMLTRAFTGLPVNMLTPSIVAAGLDPIALDEQVTGAQSAELYAGGEGPARWVDIRSAGHSVSAIRQIDDTAELVARLVAEYRDAQSRL